MKIFKNYIDMPNLGNIPEPIKEVLDAAAYEYSISPATTNAGRVLRFISKFFKPTTIIKMFAHKLAK